MSDKYLVINALQQLPDTATIFDNSNEVKFIAAVKEGREQLRRGEIVSLGEVEAKIHNWAAR